MTKGIKTFVLPGQERQATKFMNTPEVYITVNERHTMTKEGVIILYLEYEDYREEGARDDDPRENF